MDYEVTLIEARIEGPAKGEMRLGLEREGAQVAAVDYEWNDTHFTARFVGHAASMPVPTHPIHFLSKPLIAVQALRTDAHALPTDVFRDHKVFFDVG